MFSCILNVVFLQFLTVGISYAEDVIKCLQMPNERLRISCPKHHVIYNPKLLAAGGNSCTPNPNDCFGVSQRLERQINACFWKKRCTISLSKQYRIDSCNGIDNRTESISYVIIKQMYCIPREMVIDICKPPKSPNFDIGVIRSHRGYPRRKPRSTVCKINIPIGHSRTLIIEINNHRESFPTGLTLQAVKRPGNPEIFNVTKEKETILDGSQYEAVTVVADFQWKRRSVSGFIMPFIAYKTRTLEAFLGWPNISRPVMKELGWIREVRPVIEQCAVNNVGHMKLVCDADEVIYFPAVSLSGYTRRSSKCIFSDRYPCGGFTPELLVQRNLCYWKSSCDITWKGEDRIVVSKVRKCIGYSVASIGLSGHRCVKKDYIHDVCTNLTQVIDSSWGIIRSHHLYPWYFDADFPECKRIIKIGKRHALLLVVQDMNLDPDGRDKFSVLHCRHNVKKEVMNPKTGTEGSQLIVRGGKLVIKFKPFKTSKAGRGFVLVFRRFHVSKQELGFFGPFYSNSYGADMAALGDSASTTTSIRLSNRRLCSAEKKKVRNKGHACNSLVWTDYFIRLE